MWTIQAFECLPECMSIKIIWKVKLSKGTMFSYQHPNVFLNLFNSILIYLTKEDPRCLGECGQAQACFPLIAHLNPGCCVCAHVRVFLCVCVFVKGGTPLPLCLALGLFAVNLRFQCGYNFIVTIYCVHFLLLNGSL